jgi:hypothetical protein
VVEGAYAPHPGVELNFHLIITFLGYTQRMVQTEVSGTQHKRRISCDGGNNMISYSFMSLKIGVTWCNLVR